MSQLSDYERLLQEQMQCRTFASEERILQAMDRVWFSMSRAERNEADVLATKYSRQHQLIEEEDE